MQEPHGRIRPLPVLFPHNFFGPLRHLVAPAARDKDPADDVHQPYQQRQEPASLLRDRE